MRFNRALRDGVGRPFVPTGIVIVDELDSNDEAGPDIGSAPTSAAHPEFHADPEIGQTHPVLADFRNSFFAQMCHGVQAVGAVELAAPAVSIPANTRVVPRKKNKRG